MGCSEQLLRAGGCFLSTSCVPEAAPSTRGGLRGPGGADRERAPPNQRICSFRLPRAPWPSRQRQSGLPGCWAVGTPPPFPRRPGHLMGVSAVSERFHSLSKVTQGVRGGKGRTRGHGPGTHGPQGARPGCRQETGWEGRVLPHLRLTATLPTSASVEAPPHPGGQRGRQAPTLAQPGCLHWQTPPRRALRLRGA